MRLTSAQVSVACGVWLAAAAAARQPSSPKLFKFGVQLKSASASSDSWLALSPSTTPPTERHLVARSAEEQLDCVVSLDKGAYDEAVGTRAENVSAAAPKATPYAALLAYPVASKGGTSSMENERDRAHSRLSEMYLLKLPPLSSKRSSEGAPLLMGVSLPVTSLVKLLDGGQTLELALLLEGGQRYSVGRIELQSDYVLAGTAAAPAPPAHSVSAAAVGKSVLQNPTAVLSTAAILTAPPLIFMLVFGEARPSSAALFARLDVPSGIVCSTTCITAAILVTYWVCGDFLSFVWLSLWIFPPITMATHSAFQKLHL